MWQRPCPITGAASARTGSDQIGAAELAGGSAGEFVDETNIARCLVPCERPGHDRLDLELGELAPVREHDVCDEALSERGIVDTDHGDVGDAVMTAVVGWVGFLLRCS